MYHPVLLLWHIESNNLNEVLSVGTEHERLERIHKAKEVRFCRKKLKTGI